MNLSVNPLTTFLGTRRFARAPIPIYRAGFGAILGSRMLMLEHRGRATGEPRYVALEVAKRESPDSLVVASGFGERVQWYRNLRAEPGCHVWTGLRRRVPARAQLVSAGESATLLSEYAAAHPRMYRRLMTSIAEIRGVPRDQVPAGIRMVRLTLG